MNLLQLLALCKFISATTFSFLDVASDGALAREHLLNFTAASKGALNGNDQLYQQNPDFSMGFFALTLLWIILGGLLQSIVVVHLLCKRHSSLDPLSNPIRLLLLFSAPFLMGPVIVNLLGTFLIIRNRVNIDEEIMK